MNTNKLLSLLSLLLVPACMTDDLELGETDHALTAPVAPIGTFEMRGDRVYFIGNPGSGPRAYELDANLNVLRKSLALASLSEVENLTTDGTNVLFGDGARSVRLSLTGAATQTFDTLGVFNKSLRGNGGVTLRDGTLSRIITGNGFGISAWAPVEVFSGSQTTAVPVLSEGARAYVAPAGNYLRLVDVDKRTSTLVCNAGVPYATTKSLATAHDQPTGAVRVAARLADGRLADCVRNAQGATTVKIIDLPFDVGDVSFEGGGGIGFEGGGGIGFEGGGGIGFEGGGGIGFEGGGGIGIWVASANTPELAHILPSGQIVIHSLTGKLAITPIPIPRVVRSFSDRSALVLMSNQQFVRVAP
jgi:hypothetical protein